MTTYIYAKAFYFEDEVKGPGYLPILDNGTFGAFQTEKPESGATIIDYGNYQIAPGLVAVSYTHLLVGQFVMESKRQ